MADAPKNLALWWLSTDVRKVKRGQDQFRAAKARYSLLDLIHHADLKQEFWRMHKLQFQIDSVHVRDVLLNRKHEELLSVYERCALRDEQRIFPLLDAIAADAPMDVQARTFAHIADVLAAFAGKGCGLRSGPARNRQWQHALNALSNDATRSHGVALMSAMRDNWRSRGNDMMIRASRHYEGGGQRLILASTSTCRQFISTTSWKWERGTDAWAVATAPARLDLS